MISGFIQWCQTYPLYEGHPLHNKLINVLGTPLTFLFWAVNRKSCVGMGRYHIFANMPICMPILTSADTLILPADTEYLSISISATFFNCRDWYCRYWYTGNSPSLVMWIPQSIANCGVVRNKKVSNSPKRSAFSVAPKNWNFDSWQNYWPLWQ